MPQVPFPQQNIGDHAIHQLVNVEVWACQDAQLHHKDLILPPYNFLNRRSLISHFLEICTWYLRLNSEVFSKSSMHPSAAVYPNGHGLGGSQYAGSMLLELCAWFPCEIAGSVLGTSFTSIRKIKGFIKFKKKLTLVTWTILSFTEKAFDQICWRKVFQSLCLLMSILCTK